jgi:hypothetical protein
MNSTIATKITTMSKELRTRGSMPGAMRSEAMTRSFAAVATDYLPTRERRSVLTLTFSCLCGYECKRAGSRPYAGEGSSASKAEAAAAPPPGR